MKKNKMLIILLLVVLFTLIIAVFAFPRIKEGYLGTTTTVYIPKQAMLANTLINEQDLQAIEYPSEFINTGLVIKNKEDLIGKYTTVPVFTTDYFTTEKITNAENQALHEPYQLFAVSTASLASSVGGILQPGDKVNVYGYTNEQKLTYDDLKSIEVAYVLNAQGKKISAASDDLAVSIPATVVLKIKTLTQSKELLELEYNSNIHLERIGS